MVDSSTRRVLGAAGLVHAHVTGNFVTSRAGVRHLRIIAKLLALPVFCAVIISTR